MKQRFNVGDLVQMTDDAAEHYAELKGIETNIMALESFKISAIHDADIDEALYSLDKSDGNPFENSLYDYELEKA